CQADCNPCATIDGPDKGWMPIARGECERQRGGSAIARFDRRRPSAGEGPAPPGALPYHAVLLTRSAIEPGLPPATRYWSRRYTQRFRTPATSIASPLTKRGRYRNFSAASTQLRSNIGCEDSTGRMSRVPPAVVTVYSTIA